MSSSVFIENQDWSIISFHILIILELHCKKRQPLVLIEDKTDRDWLHVNYNWKLYHKRSLQNTASLLFLIKDWAIHVSFVTC